MVTERRRDFARARVEDVLRASPDRVTAPCAHRRRGCGGCPWQEVGPAAQIAGKEAIVADALRRIGRIPDPVLAATFPVATTGYRTTVHLALDADGRPAYHRRHEDTLLAVDSCLVAHPRLSEVLDSLRLPGYKRASVRVGLAGGERLVVLPAREPGAGTRGGERTRPGPQARPGRRRPARAHHPRRGRGRRSRGQRRGPRGRRRPAVADLGAGLLPARSGRGRGLGRRGRRRRRRRPRARRPPGRRLRRCRPPRRGGRGPASEPPGSGGIRPSGRP